MGEFILWPNCAQISHKYAKLHKTNKNYFTNYYFYQKNRIVKRIKRITLNVMFKYKMGKIYELCKIDILAII